MRGMGSRPDLDYARELIGLKPQPLDEHYWSPDGWCALTQVEPFVRPVFAGILDV